MKSVPKLGFHARSHAVTFHDPHLGRSEMGTAVRITANTQRGGGFCRELVTFESVVTARTATFYTRTKIRKLQAPSTDPDVTAAARHVLTA